MWQFICHESEVPKIGDYRTTMVAGKPLLVVRDRDEELKAFFNVCRHRAAEVVRTESGNASSFQCLYHHWTYSLDGGLCSISKPEGYENAHLDLSQLGLIPVRSAVSAGLLFVCLDPEAGPLEEYLGEAHDPLLDLVGSVPLEVFHFHKAEINANWKLWMDNNNEGYHAVMHVLNRATSPWILGKLSAMKVHLFPNGHRGHWSNGEAAVEYDRRDYSAGAGTLPKLRDNELRLLDVFPDMILIVHHYPPPTRLGFAGRVLLADQTVLIVASLLGQLLSSEMVCSGPAEEVASSTG